MVSQQAPVDSPFGYRSSAMGVVEGIDLSGKTAIVTGGYSGIGTETVRALASAGATVIVGARRTDVAKERLADMDGDIHILELDLAHPTSIDTFAEQVASKTDTLDILINSTVENI